MLAMYEKLILPRDRSHVEAVGLRHLLCKFADLLPLRTFSHTLSVQEL
jgi:hypothetical protein